jgi:hypothetical protein
MAKRKLSPEEQLALQMQEAFAASQPDLGPDFAPRPTPDLSAPLERTWGTDPLGKLQEANRQAEELRGYRHDWLGNPQAINPKGEEYLKNVQAGTAPVMAAGGAGLLGKATGSAKKAWSLLGGAKSKVGSAASGLWNKVRPATGEGSLWKNIVKYGGAAAALSVLPSAPRSLTNAKRDLFGQKTLDLEEAEALKTQEFTNQKAMVDEQRKFAREDQDRLAQENAKLAQLQILDRMMNISQASRQQSLEGAFQAQLQANKAMSSHQADYIDYLLGRL